MDSDVKSVPAVTKMRLALTKLNWTYIVRIIQASGCFYCIFYQMTKTKLKFEITCLSSMFILAINILEAPELIVDAHHALKLY